MKILTSEDIWNKYWENEINQGIYHLIIIDIIKKLRPEKLIEIGAGSGVDIEELKNLNFDVTYSDFSEIAFRKFKNRNPYIKAVKCDARNLPFNNDSFDLVYSLGLLEHFNYKDRKKVIKEMFRISKKYVLIDVPQKFSPMVICKKLLIFLNSWPFGKEVEFSCSQLIKDIKNVVGDVKILEKYGRDFLFFIKGNFKKKFYFNFIKRFSLQKTYLNLNRYFWWGFAESFGVVFEK